MTHCHMHMTKKTNTPHSRHKFIFTSEFVGSFFFHFVSWFVVVFFLVRLLCFWTSSQIQLRGPCFDIVDDCPLVKIRLTTLTQPPCTHQGENGEKKEKEKKKQVVKAFDFCFFSNTGGPQRAMTFQTWLRIARDLQLQTRPIQDGEK